MNNKDALTLLLTLEKDIIKNYAVAITEASYESLDKNIALLLQKSVKLQRELFNYMKENNYYTIEQVQKDKINKALSKLQNEMDNINEQ